MSNPKRSPKNGFILPLFLLIAVATFTLTSFGIALATQPSQLPSLYIPLILRNAGTTPIPTQTETPAPTLTPTPTVTVEPGKVLIVDFAFQPNEITVHVGETVEWENTGGMNHTATSNTGIWDSGVLAPDQKFSFTFTTVGDYPYHCSLHPTMTGIIHVVLNP